MDPFSRHPADDAADAPAGVADRAARALRAQPVPDLAARVMARVDAIEPRPAPAERLAAALQRAAAWIWAPRPVRVRPAYALASLAAAMVLMFHVGTRAPASIPAAEPAAAVLVQFRLDTPDAARVALAGSFSGWEPRIELNEVAPGVWSALVPLEPGVHDYLFVVDGGRWAPDPAAPAVPDGFGGENSRLFLPGAAARI